MKWQPVVIWRGFWTTFRWRWRPVAVGGGRWQLVRVGQLVTGGQPIMINQPDRCGFTLYLFSFKRLLKTSSKIKKNSLFPPYSESWSVGQLVRAGQPNSSDHSTVWVSIHPDLFVSVYICLFSNVYLRRLQKLKIILFRPYSGVCKCKNRVKGNNYVVFTYRLYWSHTDWRWTFLI